MRLNTNMSKVFYGKDDGEKLFNDLIELLPKDDKSRDELDELFGQLLERDDLFDASAYDPDD